VVRGVVAHVLGERSDSADVEECTQEAMRRAFEGRDRVRDGQALGAWAAGIARHVALDEIRSRRRARARNVDSQNPTSGVEQIDVVANVPDNSPDAFELISRADRDAKIREAMAKLPEKQREALTMFHVEGLDYKAIAARLGVPLGTVATWVLRGRRAMAEGLKLEET
jgi:RNA polymerase sigma-70 factor (ECF subfamily)